jgi:tRNA-Thr(GGU) m(6)t(6)A37 methyltransferase TsaA
METHTIKGVARNRSDFGTKFGIPRQSGLVEELTATVVFEPEFRNPDALRGLEGFSHIWLSGSLTVPRGLVPHRAAAPAGRQRRMGVFATRSPFRPNSIGLSCVRLSVCGATPQLDTCWMLGGADLMDGTPIYDIKPYAPYADAHPEALAGFASVRPDVIPVTIPAALEERIPAEKRAALRGVLAHDPRPRYQRDEARVYAMDFAGLTGAYRVAAGSVSSRTLTPPSIDPQFLTASGTIASGPAPGGRA